MECYFFNPERNKRVNKDKIKLYYDEKVKTKIIIKNNFNKIIFDNINNYDIFVIAFDDNIDFIPEKIPRFPILYNNYFIFNEFNLKEINGLSNSENIFLVVSDLIFRIKNNFGVIISNKIIDKVIKILNFDINISLNSNSLDGYKQFYKANIDKLNITTNCYSNKNYVKNNYNGWFSPMNKVILRYVLNNYDMKNIVELGAWFGKSTLFIAENTKANIYSFDTFQNTFISSFISDGNDVLDNFYFNYLRFETFHSNLRNYKNVYSVKYDCYNALELLKQNNMKIDLFYIDFLKNTYKLIKFINKIKRLYPNAIIIGDDYIIKSVKKAISILQKKFKIYTFNTCYVIFPFKIDKEKFYKELNKDSLIKKKQIINKNLENINNNLFFLYETANKLLGNNFNKFITYIKLYKLDLNLNIDSGFNNTLYIEFYIKYKNSNNFIEYENEMIKYQKSNNNRNELELTADDYKSNKITLS